MQPPVTTYTPSESPHSPHALPEEERQRRIEAVSIWTARTLWRGKAIVMGFTAAAAVLAVVISLLLPNWYQSSARVLMPDTSGGAMGALLGNLSPQASRLFGRMGGGATDYNRSLAILTSNSMSDRVIEEFDLMNVYDTAGGDRPLRNTRRKLRSNTSFEVDLQYDYLTISVLDQDPERAAAMANFFVQELNWRNAELATQDAANYRRFVEQRYSEVVMRLDSAQYQLQRIQEEMGVVELPSTAEAFFRGMAQQRAGLLQLEIQHSALLNQYGPDNPRVQAAAQALQAARSAERAALTGRDPFMPIEMAELPAAANRYATAYREVLLQGELLKVAQPLYEQARFEEERDKVTVQIVDEALPPEVKAKPHRSMIVIASTLSAFILSVMMVLGAAWYQVNGVRWRQMIVGSPAAGRETS